MVGRFVEDQHVGCGEQQPGEGVVAGLGSHRHAVALGDANSRSAHGDAHAYGAVYNGQIPYVWGFFNQDCTDNTWDGMREEYLDLIKKMAVRFAPGPLAEVTWSQDDTEISASGDEAPAGNRLEVFVPTDDAASVEVEASGLSEVDSVPWFGGTLFYASATGGPWSISLAL